MRDSIVGACVAVMPLLAAAAEQAGDIPIIVLPPGESDGVAADTDQSQPPAVRLDTIVVTGTRTPHRWTDSPVDVQLIDERAIRNSGARDLAELLEREGGVYVTRTAGRGSSIELQGLSGEQVLILVDGRRMIGRINGNIDLTRLRLDSVERVEIVKGPSSALYGSDALGGVVNVITRGGGADQGSSITLRANEAHDADVLGNAGITLGAVAGQISGGYLRTQPYDLDKSTPAEDGLDGRTRFGSGNARWSMNESASIDFYGSYSLDDTTRTDGGTSAAQSFKTRKRIEEVRTGIAPDLRFGSRAHLRLDAYYNRYFDQFLQIQNGNEDNVLDEETLNELFAGNGQFDYSLGAHRVSVGGEYQFEQLDADRLSASAERDRESLFLQDDWTSTRWSVVPGLRYDRDSQFGEQLSPKLALRYAVSSALTLRAGFGKGFRAPDFKELLLRFDNPAVGYRVEGNPDLQPEKATGFNAGLTWLAASELSFALSAYHNDVDELIDIVGAEPEGDTQRFTYRNVDRATLSGVDLQTSWQLNEFLLLQGGYGWLHSEDEATGEPLSGRPEHRANALLRYERPRYALQIKGVWVGDRLFAVDLDSGGVPTAAGQASAYALADLRAEWKAAHGLALAAGLDNVFDEGDPQYLPIAPRSIYIELRWSWSDV
jgi:outer membrane receptor for ferrienterochelin and colicins